MKRIYVASDGLYIHTLIQTFLVNGGHEVETFEGGRNLFGAFHASYPDLITLDIVVPGMDGFVLCTAIRGRSRVPIIIVSVKNVPMDRVAGIIPGSDDYIVKPFLPLELVIRVRALFRKAGYIWQDTGETLACANLNLDPHSHCVTVDNARFSVTPTEFAFPRYLMERREEAVSKQVLLKEVQELPDYDLDTRVAGDLIKRLRRKFRETEYRAATETVWGYGFRLEENGGERP